MLLDVLHDFESNNRLIMQKACMIRPVKFIENEIKSENKTGDTHAFGVKNAPPPEFLTQLRVRLRTFAQKFLIFAQKFLISDLNKSS